MKKKQLDKPIVTIAIDYAANTFTKDFLDTCSDSWYFDALDWFEYTYYVNEAQVDEFREKIQYQFDRLYIKHYGKRDDYYRLKGIIKDLNGLYSEVEDIIQRGTLTPHCITLNDTLHKLTNMQFSLGLVTSSVNRQYKFEDER